MDAFTSLLGRRPGLVAVTTMVASLAMAAGCLSTHPGSSSLAYVVIEGATLERVQAAAIAVFTADHYKVESSGEGRMVFVREASGRDQVRYGRYGESLQMRVDVSMERHDAGSVLVRADAYAVYPESALGAQKLLKIAKIPYQRSLDRVKASVEKP